MTSRGLEDLNTSYFRDLLLKRQLELENLTDATAEARAPVTLDQQSIGRLSRMDAMQGQAMALETERRRSAELQQIKMALKRLDDGNYGICLSCDEAIPLKRLELNPANPICVDCASNS